MLVAYSGGVDSAYLAWAAHRDLGDDMLAVIADSPSLARTQLQRCHCLRQRARHSVGSHFDLLNWTAPNMRATTGSAAFNAKMNCSTVMENLRAAARLRRDCLRRKSGRSGGLPPRAAGRKTAPRCGSATGSWTHQAGNSRTCARRPGLRIWDKPASACLSSRIEYGRPVTREALDVVERGEDAIRALGFRQFRVRHHGDIVRIEIAREELDRALNPAMAARVHGDLQGSRLQVRHSRSGRISLRIDERIAARGATPPHRLERDGPPLYPASARIRCEIIKR